MDRTLIVTSPRATARYPRPPVLPLSVVIEFTGGPIAGEGFELSPNDAYALMEQLRLILPRRPQDSWRIE